MTMDTSPPPPQAGPPQDPVRPAPGGVQAAQTEQEMQGMEAASSTDRLHPVVEQHAQWFETAMDSPCL